MYLRRTSVALAALAVVVPAVPAAAATVASGPCTGDASVRIAAHSTTDGRTFRFSVGRAEPGSEWRVRTVVVQAHPRAPSGFEYVDTLTADGSGRVVTRMTTDWRGPTSARIVASRGDDTCRLRLATG